jgi:hypothetical protein
MSTSIDLVKFLFLADVDINQAEYILDNYPNFSMATYQEFFDFFTNNGIKLNRYKQTTSDERLNLLEKFKSFKQTYEYEIVKKFINEQKQASLLLGTRDAQAIKDAINSIEKYDLDTFDYYIVRKILTGSENGVLPSEQLKPLLEQLIAVNTDIFAEDADLERDEYSRVISHQNIFKNKGRIKVPVVDDRFTTSRFNYIVQRGFESLPEAVSSERNILKKIEGMTTSAELDMFLSDITNLRNEDENSIAGLQAKIENLEGIISAKQELIDSFVDKEIENEAFIDAIAVDNINKDQQLEDKDVAIQDLQTTVDQTLTSIQQDVTSQISNITSALDTLSQVVVDQANAANKSQDDQINALKKELEDLKNELSKSTGGSGTSGGSGSGVIGNPGPGGPSGPLGGNPANQGGPSIGR